MTRMSTRWLGAALALVALLGSARTSSAQSTANPPMRILMTVPGSDAPTAGSRTDSQIFDVEYRYRRPVFRLGQDYTVREGEEVRHVVVVWGNVTIEGRVADDVVVVLGDVRVGSRAVIDGSVVVVAGMASIASGATVRRDLVVVGGALDAAQNYFPGGEQIIIGPPIVGERLRSVVPWVTRGLLWGRPIVPDLGWVWAVFGVVFLVSLALNHAFDRTVRASAEAMRTRPLVTFLAGMLVLVLSGPLLVILAASVVGLIVVPFAICAAVVVWAIGKVGVVRAMGSSLVRETEAESRAQALRSFVIGFAILGLAYMVPVVGGITWALVTVFGLGAGTLTLMAALRREYPRTRPPVVEPPPAPIVPGGGGGGPAAPPGPFEGAPVAPAGHASYLSMTEAAPAVPPPPIAFDTGTAAAAPSATAAAAALPLELRHFPRATFLDRVAAFALDCVLVAIVLNLARPIFNPSFLVFRQDDGAFLFALLAYHIAFWAWKGTTLGGIIVGVRIARADGAVLRFPDALVRALASVFSVAALGIGCLWMLNDRERQMWHDKIAGTYVLKVPRDYPVT